MTSRAAVGLAHADACDLQGLRLSGGLDCDGCGHCEHADRLHEEEREPDRGGKIRGRQSKVDRRLTDARDQDGAGEPVEEVAVRTGRGGAQDDRAKTGRFSTQFM